MKKENLRLEEDGMNSTNERKLLRVKRLNLFFQIYTQWVLT